MLIISIHGFRAFKLLPQVWTIGEDMAELIRQSGKYDKVRFVKLGYKNIIYEHYEQKGEDRGYKTTMQYIRDQIAEFGEPLIIIGHSLGGWSANLLTADLLSEGYNIDILVQIDAIPLIKDTRVFNGEWLEDVEKNENGHPTHKGLKEKFKSEIVETSNELIYRSHNFADSIEYEKIRPEILNIKGNEPYSNQYTYPSLRKHYYYYAAEEAFGPVDRFVHAGTGFTTKPIDSEAENLIQEAVPYSHLFIDDQEFIYDRIMEDLGVDAKISHLGFKYRLKMKIEEGKEKFELIKEESKEKIELVKEEGREKLESIFKDNK